MISMLWPYQSTSGLAWNLKICKALGQCLTLIPSWCRHVTTGAARTPYKLWLIKSDVDKANVVNNKQYQPPLNNHITCSDSVMHSSFLHTQLYFDQVFAASEQGVWEVVHTSVGRCQNWVGTDTIMCYFADTGWLQHHWHHDCGPVRGLRLQHCRMLVWQLRAWSYSRYSCLARWWTFQPCQPFPLSLSFYWHKDEPD